MHPLYLTSKGGDIMPVIDGRQLSALDIAIMKATGYELVPIDPEDNLIIYLGGYAYAYIPKHD